MAAVPEPSDAPPADAAEANGEQQQQHTPPMAQRTNGRRRRSNRLRTPRELWALHDVLTHTTFWLAQVSVSTVQALVAAFLFHRTHIAATHFDPNASGTTPPEAGLAEPDGRRLAHGRLLAAQPNHQEEGVPGAHRDEPGLPGHVHPREQLLVLVH